MVFHSWCWKFINDFHYRCYHDHLYNSNRWVHLYWVQVSVQYSEVLGSTTSSSHGCDVAVVNDSYCD